MLSVINSNLRQQPFSSPAHTVAAAVDEFLIRQPDFNSPISVVRDAVPTKLPHSIPPDSVIHIHGYNGAIRLPELAQAGENRRVVWTLHDMNPFTGACHYSLGCTQFRNQCAACPAVRSPFHNIVRRALQEKIHVVKNLKDLVVIAPSPWLAQEAEQSSVFAGQSVSVIPNPFSQEFEEFRVNGKNAPQQSPHSTFRLAVVAANLSDPVKNVGEAIQAFQRVRRARENFELHLVGKGGAEFVGEGITHRGPIPRDQMAEFFARCDILVIPSLAENSPLVIAEAASQGCSVIVRNSGGMPDVVSSLGHGDIYSHRDELENVLQRVTAAAPPQRRQIATRASELFGPQIIAEQYDGVYDD